MAESKGTTAPWRFRPPTSPEPYGTSSHQHNGSPALPERLVEDLMSLSRIEAGKSFATLGRPASDGEVGVVKVSAMTWGERFGHVLPVELLARDIDRVSTVVSEPLRLAISLPGRRRGTSS